MTELNKKIAALSPEKRALLEAHLLNKAVASQKAKSDSAPAHAPVELSVAQQSLWFLDQLQPESPFYNIPDAMRITGPVDCDALRKCFQTVVERHQVLRTQFVNTNGHPEPRLVTSVNFALPTIDLTGLSGNEQREKISQLVNEEAKRPFNLESDLLLRATVLDLGNHDRILLLTMHHIAADHWSFSVLYREITQLYSALTIPGSAPLLPLAIQYSHFARQQREFLKSDKFQAQLAYWREKLSGELPENELPIDHLRKTQNFRGDRKFLKLSADLAARLKSLSQREGATLYVTLLAAFKALLHRYSGQTDIIIGSPLGARNRLETEPLIGYFLNTVVLRTNLEGDPRFDELLRRTRDVVLGTFANQEIPFEKLIDELQIPRLPDRNPLFQTIFQYHPAPTPLLQLPGTTAQRIEQGTGTSKLDLIFTFTEDENGLFGEMEYNTDLFEADTIERMLGHYARMLESIAENPAEKISSLQILAEPERQQLFSWTKSQTDYPRNETIVQLFEKQVEQTPDAVALVFGQEKLSYRQLNERANQLACHLSECGVGPDSLVGIAIDRSFDLIIGLIAILKAGGAYVPFDLNFPEARLNFMIEDTGVNLVLTDKSFSFSNIRKIDPKNFPAQPFANLISKITPENLAYVLYTSGSTGKPKGVAIPQRAVVRLVKQTNFMRFSADQVFLQFAPVSFDASTLEIWGSLLNGAKLVIAPPGHLSLEEIGRILREQHVTTLWLTAGLFHQMVEHRIDDLRGVKQLLAGGDVLSVSHVKKVLDQLDCQLINGYGPTENTTFTCCHTIPKNWASRSVPIGKPISNTQVYVLDKNLQPTPIGVPGELFIGGDGLARGYLNRPELNAEKFISHPFQPGAIVYKTGDKVRWLADGTIEFFGRIDNQVKIRGFRIELEEIEAAINQHPAVEQSTVLVHSNSNEDKELVSYFITKREATITVSDLRTHLEKTLPHYMVPSRFITLDELPLTPNGKVDRRRLPAPDEIALVTETESIPPRNETESQILDIWREVLGRNHFGVRENFFQLGGHSLLATQVVSRVAQKFQIELSLQKIFEHPTIEGLARAVLDSSRAQARPILARRTRPGAAQNMAPKGLADSTPLPTPQG